MKKFSDNKKVCEQTNQLLENQLDKVIFNILNIFFIKIISFFDKIFALFR